MTGTGRERVFAFVCEFIQANGYSPSLREIGDEFGITQVGAWKHVKQLIRDNRLLRSGDRDRYLVLPGRIDLRPVPTDALVAELGRRRAVAHARASR
jgi:repressor LexA